MATAADSKLNNPKINNNVNLRIASNTARGLDGRFSNILDEVAKRGMNEKPQNIFQAIATQRESRDTSHQIIHYVDAEKRKHQEQSKNTTKQHSANKLIAQEFPVFFKYFRMNEISMTITYYHEKNSFLNSKDLRVKLAPFISHYKFLPFKKMFDNYEGHCKKAFISQIPNILKQKFLKAKQKVDEVTNVGVTNSLMQGVTRVRDLAVGHVGVS